MSILTAIFRVFIIFGTTFEIHAMLLKKITILAQ